MPRASSKHSVQVDSTPNAATTLDAVSRPSLRRGFGKAPNRKRILWLAAILLTSVAIAPLLVAIWQPGPAVFDEVVEDFNGGHLVRPQQLLLVQGFRSGDQGWTLAGGTTGRLIYRVIGHEGRKIGLHLWMYSPPGVNTTVVATSLGQTPGVLATNATYAGGELRLPGDFAKAQGVDIEFTAQNNTTGEVLVLDQLAMNTSRGNQPAAPPGLTFLAVGLLAALITWPLVGRRKNAPLIAIGMGVVVAIATATRMSALFAQRAALDPDAVSYRIYADRFQWSPFSASGLFSGNFGEREPFFPLVVHAYFQLIGSSNFHLRVVSSTLSIAVVILAVLAARRLLVSWWARLAVGLMVAVSGPLIAESTRGLRLELAMVLLLLLYLALDRAAARHPILDAVMIGLLGAALVLTQTYFLPVFIAAVTVSFLGRYRPQPRTVGLVGLATVILVCAAVGHRLGMYQVHHDAFWDTAGYARWLANVEHFAYHRPLEHPELFPTAAEYGTFGPYFGPYISAFQYFFVIHSPLEFVRDSLVGYREIFNTIEGFVPQLNDVGALTSRLSPRIDLATRWIALLGLIGLVTRAWQHPRNLLLPVIVVSSLASDAFLFDHGLLERYRHTWQAIPLALIAGAWLIEATVLVMVRRFGLRWRLDHLKRRVAGDFDLALFPIAVLLALAQAVLQANLLIVDAVLLAASIGVLTYRRPAVGAAALLLTVSVAGMRAGAAAGVISAIAIFVRQRPTVPNLLPILIMLPLCFAVAVAGPAASTSLFFAAEMLSVALTVAVACGSPASRDQFLVLIAAMGPLAGIAHVVEPAAAPARLLAPAAVVAAAWLYRSGRLWALALGLVDLVVVVLTDPLFSWIGVLAALAIVTMGSGLLSRVKWRLAIGASVTGLSLAAGGASLAAATPPLQAGWRTYLGDTSASVSQQITVDRAGYNSVWIFGRRASTFTDYPARVEVGGSPTTDDLNSYLPTEQMAWVRLPLMSAPRAGSVLDIQITATGKPDLVNRYIEIGGVYAQTSGLTSSYRSDGRELSVDLSPDAGTQAGTYLVVLGDESLPRAPSGFPLPLVQGHWGQPVGQCLPGECGASAASPEQAATWTIWRESIRIASQNPLHGLGSGQLAAALNTSGAGLGPGLSARSQYVQIAAEWGIPGLAGLLLMLGGAVFFAWRRGDRLATALVVLTVVSMIGESLLLDRAGAAATWMAVGLCLANTPRGQIFGGGNNVGSLSAPGAAPGPILRA